MVLFTGISKKQIASFGSVSPVSGTITSSYCHLTQPTRNRTISSDLKAAKHQTTARARTISSGYIRTLPAVIGRSSVSRFIAAQSNFAHRSRSTALGSGPIKLRKERGDCKTREGLKWMGIQLHSWQSRKNVRKLLRSLALAF